MQAFVRPTLSASELNLRRRNAKVDADHSQQSVVSGASDSAVMLTLCALQMLVLFVLLLLLITDPRHF